MMVVDGVDFMWATPSRHTSTPELVLEDFLLNSGVKVDKIRCDDATVSRSETFKLWCRSRGITICATAGYNHTMQARAEGAIRIAKEHVRCMLKTAGMPYKFWPWALAQFCRIYNYWPKKGHAPPWIMLKNHRFCQRLSRDLHPFGCYVIGHLPRDHPEVRDTTHSDRGLEGAFLGWDLHTPTVWLWSFRKKRAVRMHDPTFYDDRFPFKNPDILLNRDLTVDDVQRMHAADLEVSEKGNAMGEDAMVDEDEPTFSTPPTQPMHPPETPATPKPAAAAPPPMPAPPAPAAAAPPTAPPPVSPARPRTRSAESNAPPATLQKDVRTWTRGADVPLDAAIGILSDQQLGRALAHHKLLLHLPRLHCVETRPCSQAGSVAAIPSLPGDDGVSDLAAAWVMAKTIHLSGSRRQPRRWRACGSGDASRSTAFKTCPRNNVATSMHSPRCPAASWAES
mmetsp:Transcript_30763/g.63643  ORF Transcript_30763/g.63643 Transcript_30763/m.63643 type:complete len:452 (-) Transcript_30763:341-1696(-)